MTKDLKMLQKLAKNPFYRMSDVEKQELREAEAQSTHPLEEQPRQTVSPDEIPQTRVKSKDNAAVKETGKLSKHSSDPITE